MPYSSGVYGRAAFAFARVYRGRVGLAWPALRLFLSHAVTEKNAKQYVASSRDLCQMLRFVPQMSVRFPKFLGRLLVCGISVCLDGQRKSWSVFGRHPFVSESSGNGGKEQKKNAIAVKACQKCGVPCPECLCFSLISSAVCFSTMFPFVCTDRGRVGLSKRTFRLSGRRGTSEISRKNKHH